MVDSPPPSPPPPPPPSPSDRGIGDGSGLGPAKSKKGGGFKTSSKKTSKKATKSSGDLDSDPLVSGTVRIKSLDVTGGLSQGAVRNIVDRWLRRIGFCYDSALWRNSSLKGTMALRLVIEPSGKVESASYLQPLTMDSTMRGCVQRDARRLQFDAASEESVVDIILQLSTN